MGEERCWSVKRLIVRLGRSVTLPCSYRSKCFSCFFLIRPLSVMLNYKSGYSECIGSLEKKYFLFEFRSASHSTQLKYSVFLNLSKKSLPFDFYQEKKTNFCKKITLALSFFFADFFLLHLAVQ